MSAERVAERVYDLQEVAAIKSVHPDTLKRAIKASKAEPGKPILKAKKVGRGYRVKASDLDAWFDGLDDA